MALKLSHRALHQRLFSSRRRPFPHIRSALLVCALIAVLFFFFFADFFFVKAGTSTDSLRPANNNRHIVRITAVPPDDAPAAPAPAAASAAAAAAAASAAADDDGEQYRALVDKHKDFQRDERLRKAALERRIYLHKGGKEAYNHPSTDIGWRAEGRLTQSPGKEWSGAPSDACFGTTRDISNGRPKPADMSKWDLIVLILSRAGPEGKVRRDAVRNSWARHKAATHRLSPAGSSLGGPCSIRFFFVVGINPGSKEAEEERSHGGGDGDYSSTTTLQAEAVGDMLRIPVAEGYRNISRKVTGAMAWAAANPAADFRYLLKTDDDSYVCVSKLLSQLQKIRFGSGNGNSNGNSNGNINGNSNSISLSNSPMSSVGGGGGGDDDGGDGGKSSLHANGAGLYYGKFVYNPVPVSVDPADPLEDSSYIAAYGRRIYPPYAQGAGYLLSSDLVAAVVASTLPSPLPVVEDALVATLLQRQQQARGGRGGGGGGGGGGGRQPEVVKYEEYDEHHLIAIPHREPTSYCKRVFVLSHHLRAEEMAICEAQQPTC